MDDVDLTALSASGIAAMVHDGRTSAVRVARAHLARIAERDGERAAFQAHTPQRVLAEAESVDSRPDRFALPLAGVPVAIEDDLDVAGYPTRTGSAATGSATEPARRDDERVRRLRAAGAVVVGKTRVPESAGRRFPRSALGRTRNRSDPDGSSSGSAAAVAAGMAALALGSDGCGTVRAPATDRGLVALTPGREVEPLPGGAAEHRCGSGASGPLARSVADAALMFEVLTGPADPDDPAAALAEVGWPARVALSLRNPYPVGRLHPDHRAAAVGAAARLRAEGVAVTIADPGRRVPRPAGTRDRAPRRRQERYLGWLDGHDLMIGPATAAGPFPTGRPRGGRSLPALLRSATRTFSTPVWNLAGLPAVVVPVLVAGRPIGVQLVGRPGDEHRLLAAAARLEHCVVPTTAGAPRRVYV